LPLLFATTGLGRYGRGRIVFLILIAVTLVLCSRDPETGLAILEGLVLVREIVALTLMTDLVATAL
jgi:hypothetical protein